TDPSLVAVTQRGACKRMRLKDFTKSRRAKRGLTMLRELKNHPHRLRGFFITDDNSMQMTLETEDGEVYHIDPMDFNPSDRYSNCSFIIDSKKRSEVDHVWKKAVYENPFDQAS